jgi:hypothetical protein
LYKARVGRAVAALIGVALALGHATPRALAQPEPTIALAWQAPADCPKQAQVLDEVLRRLGGQPAAGRGRLRATGHVDRRPDGHYHVHLVTDLAGVAGDKHLEDASCAALADAAALVIALTFDPDAVAAANVPPREAAPSQPPPPAAAAAPANTTDRPDDAPPAAADERTWGFGAHLAAGAALGMLPGVAFGVSAGATLLVDRARAELGLAWYPTRSGKLEDSEAGGDFQLLAASASGCYAALLAPFEAAPCVGLSIGSISAQGTNVLDEREGSGLWVAPFAAIRLFVPLTEPVGLRADLGLELPLRRNRFVIEDLGGTAQPDTVHRAAAVVGRAAVGAEVRF